MAKRKTSRRDLLNVQNLFEETASDEPVESPFLRVTTDAMAGQFEIFLNAGRKDDGTEAALEALQLPAEIESQLSVFQATSQIGQVNALAADEPVAVEEDVFDLLMYSKQLYEATGGAFDPTAAKLSEAWGFSRRAGRIPTDEELDGARRSIGMHLVELDPTAKTVRFAEPGVKLNLGAIGKGYAIDRLVDSMLEQGVDDFMVHAGMSSVAARGNFGVDPSKNSGWSVGVHDPLRHSRRLGEIRIHDRALATSGSEKQFFRYKGRRLSHIIDPRSGQPAEELLSVTLLAPSAATADALATAMFVLGADWTLAYVESHPEMAVLLIRPGKGNQVEVLSHGFEEGELLIL
ncbi:MAG: FAD:protein FMN transferase [Planctomycetia bacterium]|jgi:thiamine biosynthesis lipoprotein